MSVTEMPSHEREFERTPPHDLAAEQCVLGSMLISQNAIAEVIEQLQTRDFYRPAHQILYERVLDLYGRGDPVDAITIKDELLKRGELSRVGDAPYLHTLVAAVPTAANAGYYARIVEEKAILRRLVEVGTRIAQLGYSTDGQDADDLLDRAQAEVYGIADKRSGEDYAPLSDIMPHALDEIEAIGSRGGQLVGVPTGFTDLDALTNGLHAGQLVIIAARPAIGKALALDTPLPTPRGWTTMGEVAVGDVLLGADGRPTTVVAATSEMAGRPCYEVEFNDGSVIVADAQHQWPTETPAASVNAPNASWSETPNQRTVASVRTTEEIAAALRCATADRRLDPAVPVAAPAELPDRDLPVPPYTLGAWLGAGDAVSARFTTDDAEIVGFIEADGFSVIKRDERLYTIELPDEPVTERPCAVCGTPIVPETRQVRTCGRGCAAHSRHLPAPAPTCPDHGGPASGRHDDHGTVHALLRSLGVLDNKHIPGEYLRASEQQRRELLAGLLDTDAHVARSGTVRLAVPHRRLADGALELVLSLGYPATMTTEPMAGHTGASSTRHVITFTPADKVVKLPRKLARQTTRADPATRCRFIVDVRPVPSVPVRCVQVDNVDHLYLAGRSWIPTHNSTLALDLARAAAIRNQLAAVVFSLEMGRNEITMRLLSAEARVALHAMRSGTMNDEDWTRLARRMSEVAEAPLFIDDSPNMSMMEIRAKCRRLKQQHDLRLVVVDYLQLMSSGKRVESRQVEVSEFSRSLKLLAKELELPVIALSQLNRGPEQRTDKKPMVSDLRESGCLTAGSRILRADTGAEVTLGELVASGERDVPVWSLDERLRLRARTMTHAFPSGVREVFRVRLASGREIEATANHPFLTYDGWRPLGDLPPGARVAVPRHVPAPLEPRARSDAEVVLLAHLVGGAAFGPGGSVRSDGPDEVTLAARDEAARRVGVTAVRGARVTGAPHCERAAARPASLRLSAGEQSATWLDSLGLSATQRHERCVPEGVFALPKRQLALFLRNVWACGGVWPDEGAGREGLHYASPSRRLVDDLARLLLRFNVMTRIERAPAGYRLVVCEPADQRRFGDEIGVPSAPPAGGGPGRLTEDVGGDTVPREVWDRVRAALDEHPSRRVPAGAVPAPGGERLSRVAAILDDASLDVVATNDVCWDELAEVESLGRQPVYDATVLGTHNFVANGIALHNSIEQDADVVILLHREDAYEKESPRAGEADLIVAKHRNGPTATVTVAFQGHYSRFVDMAH